MWPFKPNVEKMKQKGNVRALIRLIRAVKYDPDVGRRAIRALGELGGASAQAVSALIEHTRCYDYDNPNCYSRREAIAAIVRIGAAAVPYLTELFKRVSSN